MTENGRENTQTRDAAEQYIRSGLSVIPVPAGEKNPNRPDWQKERHDVEDVPRLWTNGQGIGVLWGEPSGGLVDVDLDWTEARAAARSILPDTRSFGRQSAPESHRVYRVTDSVPKSKKYKIPGKGLDRCVVEVLSTGAQSLVPPSLHDSGERRRWNRERPAAEVEGAELMEGVADVATAALITRHWPGQGARHDYALAATGYVGRRLPRARAERVMEAAIGASGDEEARGRLRDVASTLDAIDAGSAVTGGPTLDSIAPGLVDQLRRWHGWGNVRSASAASRTLDEPSFNLTDLGNAERLVARHGDDLRYVHPWGKWLVWDGKRWAVDAAGEVERRAVETVRSIYTEADAEHDSSRRKEIAQHAMRSEARGRIEAMVTLARSLHGTPVSPSQLDADPWALNVLNGTIDLRTGELREHHRGDMLTKLAPIEYDASARAPAWEDALQCWLPSEGLRSFAQRVIGHALTGDVSEQVLPFLHGPGANGKTTMLNTVLEMMGDYGQQAAPDLLLAKRGSHPTELADLFGARLVASVEVEDGRRLAESLVKQLTGGDRIKARRMREDFWEFAPTHKVFLAANHKPVVRGTDHAIWRRIKLVPFDVVIPKEAQDPRLPEKLRAELPGILAWAVRGCLAWQREGLGEPVEVRAATDKYRHESDVLSGFVDECCVVRPDAWCKFADLWQAYTRWCEESNEHPETKRRFGDSLTERGFERDNGSGNVAIRRGIALRHDEDPDPSRVNDPDPRDAHERHDETTQAHAGDEPVNEQPENVNSRNTWKTEDSGVGVNEGYRGNAMNGASSLIDAHSENELTVVNSLTVGENAEASDGREETPATPRGPAHRRLTDEEATRVMRLVAQGMKPAFAREEVLRKDTKAS
jgi:P4 family phage/plasmid primase-like protien